MPFVVYLAIRMVTAGILLLGVYYGMNIVQRYREKKLGLSLTTPLPTPLFSIAKLALWIKTIFFYVIFAYMAEHWALQYMSSSSEALLYSLCPFITALLAYFLIKERLAWYQWLGISIGWCSIVPACYHICFFCELTTLWPIIILLSAIVSSCYAWFLIRKLIIDYNYHPLLINGRAMLWGGLIYWCLVPYIYDVHSVLSMIPSIGFLIKSIGGMIVLSNVVFYNWYSYLLKKYSPTLLSFAGFSCPLFAMLLGKFFLHESLPEYWIFSLSCIVLGLSIFYYLPKYIYRK
jgi:drug/metabolite transporter (DMT)-like permease